MCPDTWILWKGYGKFLVLLLSEFEISHFPLQVLKVMDR